MVQDCSSRRELQSRTRSNLVPAPAEAPVPAPAAAPVPAPAAAPALTTPNRNLRRLVRVEVGKLLNVTYGWES